MNLLLSPQKKYQKMLGFLDSNGFVIHINRVEPNRYELQVNFQIEKQYRKRDSCNRYIKKLFIKIKNQQIEKGKESTGAKCAECRVHINGSYIALQKSAKEDI